MNETNKNELKNSPSLQSLDSTNDTLSESTFNRSDNTNSANSGYSSTSSSSAATSTSSILKPIGIRDARTRSYLVGSVGCHVCNLYKLLKTY